MNNIAPSQIKKLLCSARHARRHAYAPYSKFKVGAAVLTSTGRIFTGVNVENASYGLTLCAERAALAAAIAAGEKRVIAVAIAADYPASPCGACRQVIAEFASADCLIYSGGCRTTRGVKTWRLGELLPQTFGFS